jgi:hypothetical protein
MGRLIDVDDDVRQLVEDGISDLIDQLGKDCKLVYPGRTIDCNNCGLDPATRKSNNIYTLGGPQPFRNGTICPKCRGAGTVTTQATSIVKLLCQWNPRDFLILSPNVEVPYSVLETKGYIKDLPNVMQADRMIFELPIQPFNAYSFVRNGEPIDPSNIVPGKFFVVQWKRQG